MIIFRNILAVILGIVLGMIANMSLINLGHIIFPIEGLDLNDMDAYAALIPILDTKYFIFPFLAHALGTLVGAVIAAIVAGSNKKIFALIIGGFFLIGGIAINYLLPGKIWFTLLDIAVAYIPMAFLGWLIVSKLLPSKI